MSDVGKRPTKPGQMVMIVGPHRPENNGITGVTLHRIAAGRRNPRDVSFLDSVHWVCEFSRLPVLTRYRFDGTPIPGTTGPGNCIWGASLVVIADPDIDTSETEELNQPEGIAA